MKKHFLYISFITLVLLFSIISCSRQKQLFIKSAQKADAEGNYYGAEMFYGKALQKDSNQIEIAYRYAELCQKNNSYAEAETWYNYVYRKDSLQFPMLHYNLGEVYKRREKYIEAIEQFTKFIIKHEQGENKYTEDARYEIRNCANLNNNIAFASTKVNVILIDGLNSNHSEYGAIKVYDTLLFFSSYRPEWGDTGQYISKTYISQKGSIANYLPLDSIINTENEHVANFQFDVPSSTMFFSKAPIDNDSIKTAIYSASFDGLVFKNIKKLPAKINLTGYDSRQANVGNSVAGKYLFFVSDRPGGLGGLDIWYAPILPNGEFGEPQNAGKQINTEEDEVTPYYCTEENRLYFSSAKHLNMGGFDIFYCDGTPESWSEVQNIGKPWNTSFNDLYFVKDYYHRVVFLTSNRIGSATLYNEGCCNDLYYYFEPKESDNYNPDIWTDMQIEEQPITLETDETTEPEEQMDIVEEFINELDKYQGLKLFFDNDEPDPKSNNEKTSKNCADLTQIYKNRKTTYSEYLLNSKTSEKQTVTAADIEAFFEGKVENNFNMLVELKTTLPKILDKGHKIEIKFKAFASPLHSAQYNKTLASRRIQSVLNFLFENNETEIKKFIETQQLQIKTTAIGEEMAPQNLSSDRKKVEKSVYSLEAAAERRVEISITVID